MGAVRLVYVRRCLDAVEDYEGPISRLAARTGLEQTTLGKCYWVNKLGDSQLHEDVWEGHVALYRAYRVAVGQPVAPKLTPAERAARMSAAAKKRWARCTPEQRAAHGAKMRAAKRAKAEQPQPTIPRLETRGKIDSYTVTRASAGLCAPARQHFGAKLADLALP
jgi:hypothetical protein